MTKIHHRKLILLLTYLTTLTAALVGYLFMVALQKEGYDPQVYKKAYLYLVTFSFILFNILLPFWYDSSMNNFFNKKEKRIRSVKAVLKYHGGLFAEITMFSSASLPLIFVVFIVGSLDGVNLMLPLIMQVTWGMAILSLRGYLETIRGDLIWKEFATIMVMFTLLALTLVILYLYIQYKGLVITTFYDNDIPLIFFINPLLSIIGLLHMQMGGPTYIGYFPIIYTIGFSMFIYIFSSLLTIKRLSLTEGGV